MAAPIHKLIWADQAALASSLALGVAAALMCAIILLGAGSVSYARLDLMLARTVLIIEVCTMLPLWLLLRGIDLAVSGPAHRRALRLPIALSPIVLTPAGLAPVAAG